MKTTKSSTILLLVLGIGLSLSLFVTCRPISSPVKVFPGAEGFGTITHAGRGGDILKVTNLNDSGPGSLRQALDNPDPSTIVFEVGGTIKLLSDLRIINPYVTIAGQTAPGLGITLRGAGIKISTHDVLVQHVRIRVGDEPSGPEAESRDAIAILGPAHNVIIDHISASWAVDENISVWDGAHDVTISNCIISESLYRSTHPKGPHGNGLLIGKNVRNVALIGNLLAHNDDRNPRITGPASAVVLNNVMYNNRHQMIVGDPSGPSMVTAIGNLFIDGPDSISGNKQIQVYPATTHPGTRIYQQNNRVGDSTVVLGFATPFDPRTAILPVWRDDLSIQDVDLIEASVLVTVGAMPANRDNIDQRIVRDVRNRTGKIIDSQSEVGGWAVLPVVMRDFKVPEEPNDDDDRDGYTNIEEILHESAAVMEDCTVNLIRQ